MNTARALVRGRSNATTAGLGVEPSTSPWWLLSLIPPSLAVVAQHVTSYGSMQHLGGRWSSLPAARSPGCERSRPTRVQLQRSSLLDTVLGVFDSGALLLLLCVRCYSSSFISFVIPSRVYDSFHPWLLHDNASVSASTWTVVTSSLPVTTWWNSAVQSWPNIVMYLTVLAEALVSFPTATFDEEVDLRLEVAGSKTRLCQRRE